MFLITGIGVAPGIAEGRAFVVRTRRRDVRYLVAADRVHDELSPPDRSAGSLPSPARGHPRQARRPGRPGRRLALRGAAPDDRRRHAGRPRRGLRRRRAAQRRVGAPRRRGRAGRRDLRRRRSVPARAARRRARRGRAARRQPALGVARRRRPGRLGAVGAGGRRAGAVDGGAGGLVAGRRLRHRRRQLGVAHRDPGPLARRPRGRRRRPGHHGHSARRLGRSRRHDRASA